MKSIEYWKCHWNKLLDTKSKINFETDVVTKYILYRHICIAISPSAR